MAIRKKQMIKLDFGYYRGENVKLSVTLLEFWQYGFTLFSIQIHKFVIGVWYDKGSSRVL